MGIRSDTKAPFSAIQEPYRRAAVFLLNTTLLFLLVNGSLALLYQWRDRRADPDRRLGRIVARHGFDKVALAYPGWRREDLRVLLEESARGFANEYEPFTEFRPRPLHGRYVNFSADGYRPVRRQGPWPPEPASFNVFVFGGSTTFGLGVPDDQAIPSLLGDRLHQDACGRPVHVYNLGRHAYVARQEAALFEALLLAGRVPDVAVFVDGLNEFYIWPRPLTSDLMREALARSQQPHAARIEDWLGALPLARLARGIRSRLEPSPPPDAERLASERPGPEQVIDEWLRNAHHVQRVARAYGVRTLFVWQPVPCYKYNLGRHLLFDAVSAAYLTPARMRRGYEILDATRQEGEPVDAFLWLADIQEGREENLYVTDMHYRPVLNEEIASGIARSLEERSWLSCAPAR